MGMTVEQAAEVREAKAAFLLHYATMANIAAACRAAGLGRRSRIYDWLQDDQDFAESFEAAREEATEVLEGEAWRRAVQGVTRPVFQGGKRVGEVVEYSDALMALLLRANAPEKYRQHVELRGTSASGGGEPVDVLTPEQRKAIAEVYLALPNGEHVGMARVLGGGDEPAPALPPVADDAG